MGVCQDGIFRIIHIIGIEKAGLLGIFRKTIIYKHLGVGVAARKPEFMVKILIKIIKIPKLTNSNKKGCGFYHPQPFYQTLYNWLLAVN
jgi:hypothetical protein